MSLTASMGMRISRPTRKDGISPLRTKSRICWVEQPQRLARLSGVNERGPMWLSFIVSLRLAVIRVIGG